MDDRDEIAAELERWSQADPGKPAGRKPSKVKLVGQYRELLLAARARGRSREEIVAKLAELEIDVSWKTVSTALKPPGGKSKRKAKVKTARRTLAEPAGTSATEDAGKPELQLEPQSPPEPKAESATNGDPHEHAATRRAGWTP